jgi:hypothetical protein
MASVARRLLPAILIVAAQATAAAEREETQIWLNSVRRCGLDVGAGLILGMIDGYSNTNHGDWFAVLFPSLSAQYGIFGANLIFIPNSRNGSALALQLRLRVW